MLTVAVPGVRPHRGLFLSAQARVQHDLRVQRPRPAQPENATGMSEQKNPIKVKAFCPRCEHDRLFEWIPTRYGEILICRCCKTADARPVKASVPVTETEFREAMMDGRKGH